MKTPADIVAEEIGGNSEGLDVILDMLSNDCRDTIERAMENIAREAQVVDPTEQTPEQIADGLVPNEGTCNYYDTPDDWESDDRPITIWRSELREWLTEAAQKGILTAWESWAPDEYAPQPEPEAPKRGRYGLPPIPHAPKETIQ